MHDLTEEGIASARRAPCCEERNSQAPPTPQGVTQKTSWLNRRMLHKATSLDFQNQQVVSSKAN